MTRASRSVWTHANPIITFVSDNDECKHKTNYRVCIFEAGIPETVKSRIWFSLNDTATYLDLWYLSMSNVCTYRDLWYLYSV